MAKSLTVDPIALFRYGVLNPLINLDENYPRGELKLLFEQIAQQSHRCLKTGEMVYFSPQTIERWYYTWKHGGIDALAPKGRGDKGKSSLPKPVQDKILELKSDNLGRSINMLIKLLEVGGIVPKGTLSKSSVYRFLQQHGLSRSSANGETNERRSFEAEYANDVWYADTLHGRLLKTTQGEKKTYLISFIDDTSRLITHSQFFDNEKTLAVEYAFKQALLRRGLPKRLVLDNGSPYRSNTLRAVCARLGIRIVYCKPGDPQSKGKIERWHKTFRQSFLNEIAWDALDSFDALNSRLWLWCEKIYHQDIHSALDNKTPWERWQANLTRIKYFEHPQQLDEMFYYRYKRDVHKDGTIRYGGKIYEVPYELVNSKIWVVVEPYNDTIQFIESLQGEHLGKVHLLDRVENYHRGRKKVKPNAEKTKSESKNNLIDLTHQQFEERFN